MPQQIPDNAWPVSLSREEHRGSDPVASTHKGGSSMDDVVDMTVRDPTIDAVERLSTPPNRTSQLPSISQRTPVSNGVSSYASSDRSQLKLQPFLDRDIKDPLIISFEAFLQDVFEFNASTDINLEEICQNDETCCLLQAFVLTLDQSESRRYEPFINLANNMSSLIANTNGRECSIFARRHDRHAAENSSKATRLPDVVFVSKSEDLQCNSLHWSDIKLVLEFKVKSPASTGSKRRPGVSASDNAPNKFLRTTPFKNNRDTLQLASYALESFYHGPYRGHVVHGMIQGSMLELWYYDRVGAVRSEAVDFAKNLVLLAQFLMAIAHLSETGWGIHPRITYPRLTPLSRSPSLHPKSPTPYSTDDKGPSLDTGSHSSVHGSSYESTPESPLDCNEPFHGATITIQGREFVLGVCLVRQYALTGRGTCVIDADGGRMVVKLSWPDKSRTPEYEFLERAYTNAKEYSDGKYDNMKNHLPVLEAKEDFGEWGPRSRIFARRSTLDPSGMGSRILRVTVYQKLEPMTGIRTADDLVSVMRYIALCHRWLYRVMGILHRDITMDNIMIRRNGAKVVGVLIDYDLAVDINNPSRASLERTGVPRFMAIDLMKGTDMHHHARHDMEAMHWVLVWFSFRYEDGREIPAARRPLEKWVTSLNLDDPRYIMDHSFERAILPSAWAADVLYSTRRSG
ncbi:hypothetical protein BS47DRAFT_1489425 [Hydnum rufescens UP504]|uniref:Protein kinase domain-containing protein n=1 Tax=Hydnum rufescens UP504 TaxID=1448309 RepID=A0A9P6DPI9_9AGAM|nr:hypothetical protein BS47DRAFT_1489425 [Hydnum rufescens UP504]